jgi:hypothetical protein
MENLLDGRPRASNLKRIHVGQAIRLDLHRRKSVPEKARGKERPSFVNFRVVATQELSDLRGDAGNMNMQLVLAAATCRINRHSDLVTRQLTARPFLDETAGVPCCLPIVWRIFPSNAGLSMPEIRAVGTTITCVALGGARSTAKPCSRPLATLTSEQGNPTPMLW